MSPRRTFHVAWAVAWRILHRVLTNPALFIPPMLFPLFFFTAFNGGLSGLTHLHSFNYKGGYEGFQFVTVIAQSAIFGGVFTGFNFAGDLERGFATRYMLAAPHRTAIILGYAIGALLRAMVVWVAIITVALLTGMSIGGNGIDLVTLFTLAALINLFGALFACIVAMKFKSLQASPMMQIPIFMLLYTAPVFTPRNLLTGWIHAVSSVNPLTAFFEAGRSLVAGVPADLLLAYGAIIGLVLVAVMFAVRGMRRLEKGL